MKNAIIIIAAAFASVLSCVVFMFAGYQCTSFCINRATNPVSTFDKSQDEMYKGDGAAYEIYMQEIPQESRQPQVDAVGWSLFMANEYDNPSASRRVYLCLERWTPSGKADLDSIPDASRDLALHYLAKAVKLGDKAAIAITDSLKRSRPQYFIDAQQ